MWNGRNTADRQQERRQRLLEAGIEIMGTGGVQSVNVRAICREAKISERHFYEAFANKNDFVIAVYNAVVEDAFSILAAATDGSSDMETTLAQLIGAWIDFVHQDSRRGRIIAVEAAANRALAQRGREVAATMLQFFLSHTTSATPTPEAPKHDAVTMEVAATVLMTGVWGLLLAWLDEGLSVTLSRDELVTQVVHLVLRALPV